MIQYCLTAHSPFVTKGVDIILLLYKSLLRPRLEYCVQALSPFLRKNIKLLEKVQKRATRMMVLRTKIIMTY